MKGTKWIYRDEAKGLEVAYIILPDRDLHIVTVSGNTYDYRRALRGRNFKWSAQYKNWAKTRKAKRFKSEADFIAWADKFVAQLAEAAFWAECTYADKYGSRERSRSSWREAFRNGRCPLCGGELYEGAEFDGVSYDIWVCGNCGASFSERGRLLSKGR